MRVYDYADLNVPMLRGCSIAAAEATRRRATRFCCQPRGAGLARRRAAAGRSPVEERLRGQRARLVSTASIGRWPASLPRLSTRRMTASRAGKVSRLLWRAGTGIPACQARDGYLRSKGSGSARSATEAFLYRRLETLPQTAGLFQLNAELPIPFDGRGCMEVDLFCAAARLAVEPDGPQHLASTDAYRRDRRKDQLLQEHGHFVLRFLAEDVGKHLDIVLDAILRAVAPKDEKRVGRVSAGRSRLSGHPPTSPAEIRALERHPAARFSYGPLETPSCTALAGRVWPNPIR